MVSVKCWQCGVVFGLETSYNERREEDHRGFHCPNGHTNYYLTKTADQQEIERLKRELSTEKSTSEKHARKRRSAERKARKLKAQGARVANGTCPHCSRHFKNLSRHMKSKHASHVKATTRPQTKRAKAKGKA
jgi:DNA repair exonuclease SbcCD ATPase subunit